MLSAGGLVLDDSVAPVVALPPRRPGTQHREGVGLAEFRAGKRHPADSTICVLPDGETATDLLTMQTPLRIETEYWVTRVGPVTHSHVSSS